jgi:hypothetical protein
MIKLSILKAALKIGSWEACTKARSSADTHVDSDPVQWVIRIEGIPNLRSCPVET